MKFEESQFALTALEDDASGGADGWAVVDRRFARLGGGLGGDFAFAGTDGGDRGMFVETLSPRVDAQFLYSCAA